MTDRAATTTASIRRDTMKKLKIAALEKDLSIVDYIDYLINKELEPSENGSADKKKDS